MSQSNQNTPQTKEQLFIEVEAIEFIETPTNIIQEVIQEYKATQDPHCSEPDSSLVALSRIGHQFVGNEDPQF